MIPPNAWHSIGYSKEFGVGQLVSVRLLGRSIVVYRTGEGELVGIEDRCSHRFAPLSRGRCEGSSIRCMYHGLLFDRDGQCIEIPGQRSIPPRARLRTYPIAEQGGWVFAWGADDVAADHSSLPDFLSLDDKDFVFGTGKIDYEAAAEQVNANLLDFTHAAYVHPSSFGSSEESWGQARCSIKSVENGLSIHWWVPQSLSYDTPGVQMDAYVDNYLTYDYTVPGHLSMWARSYPAGTAQRLDFGAPDIQPLVTEYSGQSVCATGDRTSRYFYVWGVASSLPDAQGVIADRLAMASRAFEEDRIMIEAQQRVIDETPGDIPMIPNAADKAITLFERLMMKTSHQRQAGRKADVTKAAAIL
ncbi:hypothetical protein L288_02270 [Sphingobium quisquiliarum P25]|uniref:Rieske domain-containing protein n=1 Tax=Sphingobium quisquiliarum P25 TaxID=1329909 RepID=T0HNT2_9SPHN|nr:aromatic ring-hydroxylating dioxygenase subunit alpha [Sphingobium quisquiliarum]EQB13803.1 hypothetical protein L288_02270 [Sphingobium quisquiliarum P25]